MTASDLTAWIEQNPSLAPWLIGGAAFIFSLLTFILARTLIGRGLTYLSQRTENRFDDIIVAKLQPFRFAWIAPLLVIYYLADLYPSATDLVRRIVLFLILWLVVVTLNALLNGINIVYEQSKLYRGTSIQGYLDLIKIVMVVIALILTASLFTGASPVVLLSGLGAIMAILLLVFHDTLLSFVASLQIQSQDLLKEGDWVEMPSYEADGTILNIALHTVTIQNWDNTITTVPTYKFMQTPFKNWRGMQESGGRRIKRAITVDLNSIQFCTPEMVERFKQVELVRDYIRGWEGEQSQNNGSPPLTNVSVLQAYITQFLKNHPDIHQEKMTLLVRALQPTAKGLPLEVYAFTRTTEWAKYEKTQSEIFHQLIAAVPQFDLRLFQEPSGLDFQAFVGKSNPA